MLVKEIKQIEEWKKNITESSFEEEFLQSWEYGDFLKSLGRNVQRICFVDDWKNILQYQYIVYSLHFGIKYAYFPRIKTTKENFVKITEYCKKNNFTFIRLELTEPVDLSLFKTSKVNNQQPHNSIIIDLRPELSNLFDSMHSKTRYNIRLAEKKGVVIEQKKDLELYWKLNHITTQRQKFQSHSREYCEKLISLPESYQFNAIYQGKPLATAIMIKNKKTIYYFFGASSNENRNLMAPYLLHWEIIKFAKLNGCIKYDMWGIAPIKKINEENTECFNDLCWDKTHPISGVTKFKAGFGGKPIVYPDAVDIQLNPIKYKIFGIYNFLKGRKKIAGHPLN